MGKTKGPRKVKNNEQRYIRTNEPALNQSRRHQNEQVRLFYANKGIFCNEGKMDSLQNTENKHY